MGQRISQPEVANRLARAIASDISIFHEHKIVTGIKEDSLFEILAEPIAEGRALYEQRVENHICTENDFFERAVVDIIFKLKGQQVNSDIW